MKFGIATFVDDDSIDPASLARAIEERGLTSLIVAEHSHIPVSRESPYPNGGDLPPWYYNTLDPFVTLAAAAAVTSTIELVTGVALLIQRDPIHAAKESASIDLISGGRFVFGVGAGWNLEEMRDHGTDPKTRGARLDESIEAVKALKELSREIRMELARRVKLRHVPELHFHYDDSVDRGERIETLLRDNPAAGE